jgi:hypothetical protein
MPAPNPDKLERLWYSFLKNANKLGYVVKPSEIVNFQPCQNTCNMVRGRVEVQAPTSLELVDMGYKPRYSLSPLQKEAYDNQQKL